MRHEWWRGRPVWLAPERARGPQCLWGCSQVFFHVFHHGLILLHGGIFLGFRL